MAVLVMMLKFGDGRKRWGWERSVKIIGSY